MRRAGFPFTVGLCSAFHVLPRSVERSRSREPEAKSALPARSIASSLAFATSLPLTAENVSPLSVDRRRPVGPASRTVDVVGAASSNGRAVVPVSSVFQVAPPSLVRNRPPDESSA
jgi:hypothetical protein